MASAASAPPEQRAEVARIAAFSDGVFAIAITLLALQLDVPRAGDLGQGLAAMGPSFLSFCISFVVIGSYWVVHHRIFAKIRRYDGALVWLNLLALFFIVVMPFSTQLIGERGDEPLAVIVYACTIAGAGLANAVLTMYAYRGRRLISEDVGESVVRVAIARSFAYPACFLLSLALLPLGTAVVLYSWIAIPFVQQLIVRAFARRSPS